VIDRPLPPGPVEFDEEGDPVPLPSAGSDLATLIAMMEFARRKHFAFEGGIRVGSITIQSVRDLRQLREFQDLDRPPIDAMPDIFEQHGAKPGDRDA
jgi:hypothetical protein